MIDSKFETITILKDVISLLESGALLVEYIKTDQSFDVKRIDGQDIAASIEMNLRFRRNA